MEQEGCNMSNFENSMSYRRYVWQTPKDMDRTESLQSGPQHTTHTYVYIYIYVCRGWYFSCAGSPEEHT